MLTTANELKKRHGAEPHVWVLHLETVLPVGCQHIPVAPHVPHLQTQRAPLATNNNISNIISNNNNNNNKNTLQR